MNLGLSLDKGLPGVSILEEYNQGIDIAGMEVVLDEGLPGLDFLEGHWLERELGAIDLGDERLNWRLIDTGKKLSSNPGAPINQACDDWADTKGSYRLFDNAKTEPKKILTCHYKQTGERSLIHSRVLAIQDTSYLDYSHHPDKEGMGPIGTTKQKLRGTVMHSTLLTTCTGLPLGLINQNIWVRPVEAKQLTTEEKRKLPIEEKESFKWLQAMSATVDAMPEGPQVITVGDCEADIFELFNHARKLETDLLIRACQDHAVTEPIIGHLWKAVKNQPLARQLEIDVPVKDGDPKRKAIGHSNG